MWVGFFKQGVVKQHIFTTNAKTLTLIKSLHEEKKEDLFKIMITIDRVNSPINRSTRVNETSDQSPALVFRSMCSSS